jgi:hypothetical protein
MASIRFQDDHMVNVAPDNWHNYALKPHRVKAGSTAYAALPVRSESGSTLFGLMYCW